MKITIFSTFVFISAFYSCFGLPRIQKRDAQDDEWIKKLSEIIKDEASDIIERVGFYLSIDPIEDSFFGVKVIATEGTFGNLSTLNIVDVSVSTTSDSITTRVQLSLDSLEISYDTVEARVLFFSVDGSVKVTVGKNLFTFEVTLQLNDDKCEAILNLFEITVLEDIILNIPGIDKFLNTMATKFANTFTSDLKPVIEGKVIEIIQPRVDYACEYFDKFSTSF